MRLHINIKTNIKKGGHIGNGCGGWSSGGRGLCVPIFGAIFALT
jgi:hypothetical protein